LLDLSDLVVTVCDQAHEELAPHDTWLHWSITDPVGTGDRAAFDDAVSEIRDRIAGLVADTEVRS
jgi:ArsR family transcriptional regulator, arsenate/arsenite/antimonite-responsive transcriptional repressor / arsenate reductase (thioredoxin)